MDGLAHPALERWPVGLCPRRRRPRASPRTSRPDAAGQVQIEQRADDVFGPARRALRPGSAPGRKRGAAPAPRAMSIGKMARCDRADEPAAGSNRYDDSGAALGCGDSIRPERAHRQRFGEVVALEHRRGVQPGLAARPALHVGRCEQRLARSRQLGRPAPAAAAAGSRARLHAYRR